VSSAALAVYVLFVLCERMRPVPLAFLAGLLVVVSFPAALVLCAAVLWERTFAPAASRRVART
jgi:hypothetical protein